MWNPNLAQQEDDDDSWEVRAFAEDMGGIMGTTWPPRSYTCTFCRREFRSAQALGGHMNVHRRDRARLHHPQPPGLNNVSPSCSSLAVPTQELVGADGTGLCLLYRLPYNPNYSVLITPTRMGACDESIDARPALLSESQQYLSNSLVLPGNFPVMPPSSAGQSGKVQPSASMDDDCSENKNYCREGLGIEGLDLELRLGKK